MNETFKKLLKGAKTYSVNFERSLAHFSHSPMGGLRITWGCESGHWQHESAACAADGVPRILAGLVPNMAPCPMWDGPEGVASNIPVEGLWEALLECWPYASTNKTSTNKMILALNGVHIGTEGCVATDGQRLSLVAGSWGAHLTPDERHLIVPSAVIKMAKPLMKRLTTFRVFTKSVFTEKMVRGEDAVDSVKKVFENKLYSCMMNFVAKDGTMFTASWDCADVEPYPNYRQLVPRQYACRVEVNLDEMREALAKAAPLLPNGNEIALTPVHGGWALEVRNFDLDIREYRQMALIRCLPLDAADTPPRIGFNAKYLLEVIGKKAKTAVFKMNSPTQAVVIDRIGKFEEGDFKILMPIRLVEA